MSCKKSETILMNLEKREAISNALRAFKRSKFVLVRRRRIRIWHSWLVVGVLIGVIIAVMIIASRTGGTN